jgi:hypothetical protein
MHAIRIGQRVWTPSNDERARGVPGQAAALADYDQITTSQGDAHAPKE